MAIKRVIINGSMILGSLAVGLVLCEFASRLFLKPIDYLSPVLVRDDALGIRLPPGAGGHDAWGFRNPRVPASADVVALGDSHTYGNTAKMTEAWPSVLGRLLGRSVYNMGMGGYGPNQYAALLSQALRLAPKAVVCGFYMGDDFDNAVKITYGLDHWRAYRDPRYPEAPEAWDIWEKPSPKSWHKSLRNWLSSHSILYRLVVHGLMGRVKADYQIRNASRLYGPTPTLDLGDQGILEAFQPTNILAGLDQKDPKVQEGMRIAFRLLLEMNEACRSRGVRFIVLVIPTKESVFAKYLEHRPSLPLADKLDGLIASERTARARLFAALEEAKIPYVDALDGLVRAVGREHLYAASAIDMHPNKNGYRVIAEAAAPAVAEALTAER
jgi:lysophospholipase L1-like esterase